MIDRTNVGISPLLSTPITPSYLITPEVQTTSFIPGVISQPLTYPRTNVPVAPVAYSSKNIDQGFTFSDTTFEASIVPQTSLPDQPFTTMIPDTTPSIVPTPDVQTLSVLPDPGLHAVITPTQITGPMLPPTISSEIIATNTLDQTTSSLTKNTLDGTTVPPPAPQNPPIGPIMDEDFQRGRPIYDEFIEDRYRGFRFCPQK